MSLEEWNQRYRTRDDIDDQPAQLLIDAVRGVTPGRALDLACGAGRNAVWLHRAGWDVVGVDGSEEATLAWNQYSGDSLVIHLYNEVWRVEQVDKEACFPSTSIYEFLKRRYNANGHLPAAPS